MALRSFSAQWATIVRFRRRTMAAEEFIPMLNDFLKSAGIPPVQEHELIAFEEDNDAGVPTLLFGYLTFLGARLSIGGVRKEEKVSQHTGLEPQEEMQKKHEAYILNTKKSIKLVEALTVAGDFKIKGAKLMIEMPDGTVEHATLGPVREKRALDLLKEAFVLGLYDQVKHRERLVASRREQLFDRSLRKRP